MVVNLNESREGSDESVTSPVPLTEGARMNKDDHTIAI
jgi:hypothetical protein